jgi:hypothetical protein
MLAVSGRLQPSEGGPPVWPSLPEEVLKANPAFLDDNKEKTKGWYPSPPEKLNVRSIYLVQKRTVPVPMMAPSISRTMRPPAAGASHPLWLRRRSRC